MTEQTPSAEDRAREIIAGAHYNERWSDRWENQPRGVYREPYYEIADAQLSALSSANLAIIDSDELAQLRQAAGWIPIVLCLDCYQRWQAEQARSGEEAGR